MLSNLGWHFRMLFQNSKLKARTSIFTATWQEIVSSFDLWAFENVTSSGIGWRVPGLPIRKCAWSSNNLVPNRLFYLSTKGYQNERNRCDTKSILWAFVLVSGLSPFELQVHCPCAPTPPLFSVQLFLDFRANFFPSFFVSTWFRYLT